MKKNAKLIQIAFKSLLKKNRGNKLFLVCAVLLMFIPTFLYTTTQSVMHEVERSYKLVFGNYTDIYYDAPKTDNPAVKFSSSDFEAILPGFHYEHFGVFYTAYRQELSSSKTLNVGYADDEALSLAEVTILEGTLPKNDDEIALTQGVASLLGNKVLGGQVEFAGSVYTVSGIIQDFGHLWPRGESQIENNVGPVNAFVTFDEAGHILNKTRELTRQILVVRQLGVSNPVENKSDFFRNVNNSLENQKKFIVPNEFRVLIYIASILIIFMVLSLNRRRLAERLKNYNLQGLIKSEVIFITRFELIFLGLTGLLSGAALGCAAALFALKLISPFTEQQIPLNVDFFSVALLFAALFAGVCALILIFSRYMANEALREEPMQCKMQHRKVERMHLLKFELNQDRRNLASIALLIVFAFSMLSYGVFYGKYFSRDVFEATPGTLPRDFDFQFEARPLPGTPLPKGEKAFYATDTLEKVGATDEFIEELLSEPAVKSVKAYKEINKMNVLIKDSQIEDYIDGYDFCFDGNYDPSVNIGIEDLYFVRRHFGYQSDDILVGAEILSYPPDVLKSLERSVVEGNIDLDKIISGEEVVLRVPAYIIENMKDGGISRTSVPYTQENAFNSTTFKVGDEIHLSGLLTGEWISGIVPESKVGSFSRHDVVVKVGAIIRSTDGRLPFTANFGKPFSVLTVHEAFKAMKIPATYSVVDIYTRDGYNSSELSRIITNHSYKVPHMKLEDWQADIKTYKVFNLMIYIFVATLLTVLALTTLAVLMSQLLAKTQLGMKNYALLRINGLSFRRLVRLWVSQVSLIIIAGCLIGIPVSLFVIQYFGIKARFEILYQISYYFPMINLLYIFIGILAISVIASLPCLLYLKKHKDNILFDIH